MEYGSSVTLDFPIQTIAFRPRISDVLTSNMERDFSNFAVTPSNIRATESVIRFASGINPFVAVVGASGWGKTHLLEAAAIQLSNSGFFGSVTVSSAQEWIISGRLKNAGGILILDNAQELLQRSWSRNQLHVLLDRRIKGGKPTLLSFTEPRAGRILKQTLPSSRDWVIASIKTPNQIEKSKIISSICEREQMNLSQHLIEILGSKLEGNGRTITGALKRLRLSQSDWRSDDLILQACGVLNPFFASNSGWDLREHIAEKAKQLQPDNWGNVVPFDLAIFVMLKVAQLSEADVAKFFRIEPHKAYLFATRFAEKVQSDSKIKQISDSFVQEIISDL